MSAKTLAIVLIVAAVCVSGTIAMHGHGHKLLAKAVFDHTVGTMGVNPEIQSVIEFGLHTDVPSINSLHRFFGNQENPNERSHAFNDRIACKVTL